MTPPAIRLTAAGLLAQPFLLLPQLEQRDRDIEGACSGAHAALARVRRVGPNTPRGGISAAQSIHPSMPAVVPAPLGATVRMKDSVAAWSELAEDGSQGGALWLWHGTNAAGNPFELAGASLIDYNGEGLLSNEYVVYPYPAAYVRVAFEGAGT